MAVSHFPGGGVNGRAERTAIFLPPPEVHFSLPEWGGGKMHLGGASKKSKEELQSVFLSIFS